MFPEDYLLGPTPNTRSKSRSSQHADLRGVPTGTRWSGAWSPIDGDNAYCARCGCEDEA